MRILFTSVALADLNDILAYTAINYPDLVP
jgi:hypothetical protein